MEGNCKDCGFSTLAQGSLVDGSKLNEYYMVYNNIWKQAKGGRGLLCIGCLESRLGRQLYEDDFTDAPINFMFREQSTQRLLDALNRKRSTLVL